MRPRNRDLSVLERPVSEGRLKYPVARRDQSKIRLLLVDDHPLVREGIRSCLSSHVQLEIVGEAADGREALSQARSLKPDIILMDINLPGLNGLEATRLLRE